jgi:hypothetical protein
LLDGDTTIVAIYRAQYLLRVNSIISAYSRSTWYYPGSNVTLSVDGSVPGSWPLGLLGVRYIFKGWSGSIHSGSAAVNVTINQPTTITADFELDYTTLVIPVILLVGILGGAIVAVVSRRLRSSIAAADVVEETEESEETEETEEKETRKTEEKQEVSAQGVVARFCDGCGKPVEKDWTHCTQCGRTLRSS